MLRSKKEVDRHVKEIFGKMKSDTDVNRNLKGYNIARLYFNINEYGSAKRYVSEFLSIRPKSPEGHKLLGQIYEEQNEKEKAIQSYKISYEIMNFQKDLVLKICDLYASIGGDTDVIMHWIELGEKLYPQHENIAALKHSILKRNSGQSKEEMEKMYLGEVRKSPWNVNFHLDLLNFYIEWSTEKAEILQAAYHYIIALEPKELFPNSFDWYLMNLRVLQAYEKSIGAVLDKRFDFFYLLILDRVIFTSIMNGTAARFDSKYSQADALLHLTSLDAHINQALMKYGESPYLTHLICQNYFYFACHLSQLGQKQQQSSFNNVTTMVGVLLLLSVNEAGVEESEISFEYFKKSLVHRKIRISQAGHILYHMAGIEKTKFLNKAIELAISKGTRQHICSMMFDHTSLPSGGYFITNESFSVTALQFPSSDVLINCDKLVMASCPHNLHLMLWLMIQYTSKQDALKRYDLMKTAITNGLPFSTMLSVGTAETLCKLDIFAFLESVLFCYVSNSGDNFKAICGQFPSQVLAIPTNEQYDWWNAVVAISNNSGSHKLNRLQSVLQKGLASIRIIGSNCPPVPLIVYLAKFFSECARNLQDSEIRATVDALEERAEHYWLQVVHQCKKIVQSAFVSSPKSKLFMLKKCDVSVDEATEFVMQGKIFLEDRIVNKGKRNDGLQALGISTSFSASEKLNWQYAPSETADDEEVNGPYETSFNIGQVSSAQLPGNITFSGNASTPCKQNATPIIRRQLEQRSPDRQDIQVKQLLDMQAKTVKALEEQNVQVRTQSDMILAMSHSRVQDLKETLSHYRDTMQEHSGANTTALLQSHITLLDNRMKDLQIEIRSIATEVSELRALHLANKEVKCKKEEPVEAHLPLDVTNSSLPNVLNLLNYYSRPPVPGALLQSGLFPGAVPTFAPPASQPSPSYPSQPSPSYPTSMPQMKQPISPAMMYPHMKMAAQQMVSTTIPLPSTLRGMPPATAMPSIQPTHPFRIPEYGYPFSTPTNVESPKMPQFNTRDVLGNISSAPQIKKDITPIRGNDLGLMWKKDSSMYVTPTVPTEADKVVISRIVSEEKSPAKDPNDESNDEIPEFEPNLHFVPVVDLPDLVEVVTGEEDETVLFCEKAKLFRFDSAKEWKHRGIGDLKILQNKITKQCRIVMRRYQTKKMCANHILTPQMKLTPFQMAEKAWVWSADGFADEELKVESLSAQFETDEIAREFKNVFDSAVKLAPSSEKPASVVSEAPPKPTVARDNTSTNKPSVSSKEATLKPEVVKPAPPAFGGFSIDSIVTSGNTFNFGFDPTSKDTVRTTAENTTVVLTAPISSVSQVAPMKSDPPKVASSIFGGFSVTSLAPATGTFTFGLSKPAQNTGGDKATSFSFLSDKPLFGSPQVTSKAADESNESIEEFEPNVDSKPVIEMPDLVSVVTGVQNDEELFAERAKLYRFDDATNGWKERGIGLLKILKSKEMKNRRIVMHRDKTLEMCANHFITEDLNVSLMENSKRDWLWLANDYSDEEPKMQRLHARFKTEELGKKFKQEFDASVEYASKNLCLESHQPMPTTSLAIASSSPMVKSVSSLETKLEPVTTTASIFGGFSVESISTAGGNFTFGMVAPTGTQVSKSTTSIFNTAPTAAPSAVFSFGIKPGAFNETASVTPAKLFFNNTPADGDDADLFNESVDECEPTVDFKPVVPLPALVDVKTGEEHEEAMFCEKAKLYRYDRSSKAYKERGLGNIKISKNVLTGKYRVLMRREKTHKMCANHVISEDMKLIPMETAENAWVWNANDFADEEVSQEQLCVRFKTKKQAEDFKLNFEAAFIKSTLKAKLCEPAATQTNEPSNILKTPTTTFTAAGLATPSTPISQQTPKVSASESPFLTPSVFGEKFISKAGEGLFGLKLQPAAVPTTPKPSTFEAASPSINFSAFSTPTVGAKSVFGGFSPAVISTTSRQDVPSIFSTPTTTTPIFGVTPSNGVSIFGGVAPTSKVNVPASFGFNSGAFGMTGQQNFQTFGGVVSTTFDTIGNTVDKSAFVKQPLFRPAKSKDDSAITDSSTVASGDENDEYEPDVKFKPVIEMPQLVEVKTGEEGQEQMFCGKAKLYRFDTQLRQWKERGVGNMKILRDESAGKTRILMRREQTHKLCANHCITPSMQLKVFDMANFAWLWSAQDFADQELVWEQFAIKFKTAELATEFQLHFNNGRDYAENWKPTELSVQHQDKSISSSSEDEVELVYRKLANPEQLARARHLQLPDNYFAPVLDWRPCEGCIGCISDDDEYADISDEDEDNSGDYSDVLQILFKEDCKFYIKDGTQWNFQSEGDLVVAYNEELYCVDVMFDIDDICTMQHEISMETIYFEEGPRTFSWIAYDRIQERRNTYMVELLDTATVQELKHVFEEGKKIANGMKCQDSPSEEFYEDTFDESQGKSFEE